MPASSSSRICFGSLIVQACTSTPAAWKRRMVRGVVIANAELRARAVARHPLGGASSAGGRRVRASPRSPRTAPGSSRWRSRRPGRPLTVGATSRGAERADQHPRIGAGLRDRRDRARDRALVLDVDVELRVRERVERLGERAEALAVTEVDRAQLRRGQARRRCTSRPASRRRSGSWLIIATPSDDACTSVSRWVTPIESGVQEREKRVLRRVDREPAMGEHPRGSGGEVRLRATCRAA